VTVASVWVALGLTPLIVLALLAAAGALLDLLGR
jgi:hypothetical protein